MRIFKKIVLSTLTLCSASFTALSPLYATESCTQGVNCLSSINGNTYDTSTSNQSILNEVQNNLAFGTGNFDASTNGDLKSINSAIYQSTYSASRFFILSLDLATFNQTILQSINFNVAVNDASDFSNKLNDIHDIDSTLVMKNYFYPRMNNGYNPIYHLDIAPYKFPRSSQLIQNSLGSNTPMNFLNYVYSNQQLTAQNIDSEVQNYCSTQLATTTLFPRSFCIQPFLQLNRIGGFGFLVQEDDTKVQTGTQYSTSVPLYWDFLEQNISPLVIPSLDASTLVNPITYKDSSSNTENILPFHSKLGLYGRTELSAADNFIRYLSGDLLPNIMTTSAEYNQYYNIATNAKCYQFRLDAAMKIKAYRTMLRIYAAQASVGNSNLYHIMQRRRATTVPGTTETKTSQLEQEYKMATYRIFNATSTATNKKTDWQERLETASSASIQKQMALLLAEINYQLYLNRQEQERILLTLSAMQLANNTQAKKQLTISEASSYISPINIPGKDINSTCTGVNQTQPLTNADD